jgi:hypothetical protein
MCVCVCVCVYVVEKEGERGSTCAHIYVVCKDSPLVIRTLSVPV